MYQISLIFMEFILFSLFGYIAEMSMCLIVDRKLTNRGFFCGPIIPIYGVGGLFISFLLMRYQKDPVIVFVFGVLITTTIEYITSYALEKIFHNKWWDYSKNKFNLNGRICLLNSTLFGIGSLVIVYLAHPIFIDFLTQMKHTPLIITAILCFILFLIDCIYSCIVAYNLRNRLIIVEQLKNEKLARIPGMLERMLKRRVAKFKKYPSRLLKAFPTIKKSNEKEFELMRKLQEKKKSKKKKEKRN